MKEVNIVTNGANIIINAFEEDEIGEGEETLTLAVRENAFTIVSTVLSSVYTFIWAVVFSVYIEIDNDHSQCHDNIKIWVRVSYGIMYALCILSFICCIAQVKMKKKLEYLQKILFFRTLGNYIIGCFLVISMTIIYCKYGDLDKCPTISKIIIAFVVSEWVIVGGCIITFFTFVIIAFCCKARATEWNGEGEVPEAEIRKVYKED